MLVYIIWWSVNIVLTVPSSAMCKTEHLFLQFSMDYNWGDWENIGFFPLELFVIWIKRYRSNWVVWWLICAFDILFFFSFIFFAREIWKTACGIIISNPLLSSQLGRYLCIFSYTSKCDVKKPYDNQDVWKEIYKQFIKCPLCKEINICDIVNPRLYNDELWTSYVCF